MRQRAQRRWVDAALPHRRILVVEDDQAVAASICAILEHAGHEVTCTLDSPLALQQIGKLPFDVIITDIFMADVDGTTLIRETRRLGSRAWILAISGGGNFVTGVDALRSAKMLGASAVLLKPFTAAQLLAMLGPEIAPAKTKPAPGSVSTSAGRTKP